MLQRTARFTRHAGRAAAATILMGAALAISPALGTPPALAGPMRASGSSPIQHVVIVVQESRSFDDLFCDFAGADAAPCRSLQAIPLEANCALDNSLGAFEEDRSSGNFNLEATQCPGYRSPVPYAYVPKAEIGPYRSLAGQYVLADQMFSSTGNPSFEAHQYAIAAQAANVENGPMGRVPKDGCVYRAEIHRFRGPDEPACFTYKTLGAQAQTAGLTWTYYRWKDEPWWDAYGWIYGSAGSSWYAQNSITPPSQFLSDVANGKLSNITWVTPEWLDSDESGVGRSTGPAWVASVINAVGESSFWNSTAIFVTWSGFGGWADHVVPPVLDREGLGFRVPLLVVSPYAKAGYVTHVQLETASLLRFTEDTFGLHRLAKADARANSPSDAFDFNQAPRAFTPIQSH
jgi:phospholipase C